MLTAALCSTKPASADTAGRTSRKVLEPSHTVMSQVRGLPLTKSVLSAYNLSLSVCGFEFYP